MYWLGRKTTQKRKPLLFRTSGKKLMTLYFWLRMMLAGNFCSVGFAWDRKIVRGLWALRPRHLPQKDSQHLCQQKCYRSSPICYCTTQEKLIAWKKAHNEDTSKMYEKSISYQWHCTPNNHVQMVINIIIIIIIISHRHHRLTPSIQWQWVRINFLRQRKAKKYKSKVTKAAYSRKISQQQEQLGHRARHTASAT